ncbi:MAG: hypothetical protein POH28_12040, partial [Acidocella sp.]|nr:hypothetical protein [Acidocella sp.]
RSTSNSPIFMASGTIPSDPDARNIDAVIRAQTHSLEQAQDLPRACTLSGQCQEVCPVAIPLPTLLRGWREKSWQRGFEPATVRSALVLWRFMVMRPRLYEFAGNIGLRIMPLFARGGWISRMPLAGGWTAHRDMPSPSGGTFLAQYRRRLKQ